MKPNPRILEVAAVVVLALLVMAGCTAGPAPHAPAPKRIRLAADDRVPMLIGHRAYVPAGDGCNWRIYGAHGYEATTTMGCGSDFR